MSRRPSSQPSATGPSAGRRPRGNHRLPSAPAGRRAIRFAWRGSAAPWRLIVAVLAGMPGLNALAQDLPTPPATYIAKRWDTESGLPHNGVRAIFQTRDGYLWVGTQQGLARFDGIEFTIFNQHNTPAILNNHITSFAQTGDGSLWIGTSYGLVRYRHHRFTGYTAADGIRGNSGTVNTVCVAPDGSLWIGTQDGITRWVGGRFVHDIDTSRFDTHGLRSIDVGADGAMWIAVGTGLLRYAHGRFTSFTAANGLPGSQVHSVTRDQHGAVVAVTETGLFRLEQGRFEPFRENAAMGNRGISSALLDDAGNLWIGSVGGLERETSGRLRPYVDRHGDSPGLVYALFEDREHSLWVGTATGLYRLTKPRGYSLTAADGLHGTLATSVLQSRDGAIWVATWGGGDERFARGRATHYAAGAPLSYMTTSCLYQAPDGVMWLGMRNSAVDRLDPATNRTTTYVYPPGVATSRPVTAMYAGPDHEFLLGISKRGLLQLQDGKITPVPGAAELTPETVWTIQRLRDGRLVLGTSTGLFRRRSDGRWVRIEVPGVPLHVGIRDLLQEPDGTVWLATDGSGLVRWAHGRGTIYDSRRGMVDDTLYSILDDGRGALWVSSARGIGRVPKAEITALDRGGISTLDMLRFGREDGLVSGSTSGFGSPSAVRLADGRILTATDNGVAVINPAAIATNNQAPNVVIENATADDHPLPLGGTLRVPPGTNRLEIKYTALSLVAPHRLRFRYRLGGSDPNWIDAGHQRIASYTHLKPGRYTFRVLACNNDGIWNYEGASLTVAVQPRFYQTLLFRILTAAAVAGSLAGLVGWRVRNLKRKQAELARTNAELDQRVRERTAELERSNAELQQRETLFRVIFEHAPIGISWHRSALGPAHHFNSAFRRILDLPGSTLSDGSHIAGLVHPDDAPRLHQLDGRIRAGEIDSYTIEQRFVRGDGVVVYGLYATAVVRDEGGRMVQVIGILEDITARKAAQDELASTYKRLMEVSRLSGMAEVATGVLHNVGNVLNSVNVSVGMLSEALRHSRVTGLEKLSRLLHDHAANLAAFLSGDPRGQRTLPYLDMLAAHLRADHDRMLQELESLRANVDHIKAIVARQQDVARHGALLEHLSAPELADDALRMNSLTLRQHAVEVTRDYTPVPPMVAERHKVMQILINLIQNAQEALQAGRTQDRRLTVRIAFGDGRVRFEVSDNGVGIAADNLTRIFKLGFTTRPSGHGFGLHSSANAAQQMNGSLSARSPGPGLGATFILELPAAPPSAATATDA